MFDQVDFSELELPPSARALQREVRELRMVREVRMVRAHCAHCTPVFRTHLVSS